MLETTKAPSTKTPSWKWSAVLPVALLVGLPIGMYTAFVVAQCFWNWFAGPALRLPEISFLQMLGLWWMIDLLIRPSSDGEKRTWALLASITELCVPPERVTDLEELKDVNPFVELIQGLSGAFGKIVGNTLTLALGFGLHLFIS